MSLEYDKSFWTLVHVTAPENWHGILRYGLKNASHTKLMTAGARHGAGIYLSPQGSLSLTYSMKRRRPATAEGNLNTFLSSADLAVLALCEVAKVPSLRQHEGGRIWVAPDEESVVTRFLFAFPGGIPPCAGDLNSQSESFESQVRQCLAGLGKLQDGSAL